MMGSNHNKGGDTGDGVNGNHNKNPSVAFTSSSSSSSSSCYDSFGGGCVSQQQAWAVLARHARDEIAPLRLQELCRDRDRVSSLVAVYNTEFILNHKSHQNHPSMDTTDGNCNNPKTAATATATAMPITTRENRSWIVDLSRQHMTAETLNHLLRLATSRQLRKFITQTAWGQNNPHQPVVPKRVRKRNQNQSQSQAQQQSRSDNNNSNQYHYHYHYHQSNLSSTGTATQPDEGTSTTTTTTTTNYNYNYNNNGINMHLALRVPSSPHKIASSSAAAADAAPRNGNGGANEQRVPEMLTAQGENALTEIHLQHDRFQRIAVALRSGSWRGATGQKIKSVVVIGRGVPMAALQFIHTAWMQDERAVRASQWNMDDSATTNAAETATARLRRNLSGLVAGAAAAAAGGAAGSGNGGDGPMGAGHHTNNTHHQAGETNTGNLGPVSSGVGALSGGDTHNSSSTPTMTNNASIPHRSMVFITSMDPVDIAARIKDLDPACTLVISLALTGNEETGLATKMLKSWLLAALSPSSTAPSSQHPHQQRQQPQQQQQQRGAGGGRPDVVLAKHMMLVTANDRIATVINKPESVHVIPPYARCEPFTTFTAATLLPLSIVFGWSLVEEFLAGAHDMDVHFVETNPRHNICVLLALADVWNDVLSGGWGGGSHHHRHHASSSSSPSPRMVAPSNRALAGYPSFCAALEAQACSCRARPPTNATEAAADTAATTAATDFGITDPSFSYSYSSPPNRSGCPSSSSLVIDGGLDGIYDRALYQAEKAINTTELVLVMDPQVHFNTRHISFGKRGTMEDIFSTQDTLICSLFAHADELAFGSPPPPPVAAATAVADNSRSMQQQQRQDSTPMTARSFVSSSSSLANGSTTSLSQLAKRQLGDPSTSFSDGNRSSLLLICGGKLDAFACGQLIALSEHRALVKAHLWGINPFAVRDVGSSFRLQRTDLLNKQLLQKLFSTTGHEGNENQGVDNDGGDSGGMAARGTAMSSSSSDYPEGDRWILSTKTLLEHYANLTLDCRGGQSNH